MTHFKNIALSLTAILGLTACETVEGAGRDIEDAGQAISEAADE